MECQGRPKRLYKKHALQISVDDEQSLLAARIRNRKEPTRTRMNWFFGYPTPFNRLTGPAPCGSVPLDSAVLIVAC